MRKLLSTVALIADMLPGALAIAAGIAVIIGGATGALWT